jgi:hypothetical protein
MADKALYKAKFNGRNQACNGDTAETSNEDALISEPSEAATGTTV